MEAFYKIKVNELDSLWIESIKIMFHDKNPIIKVSTELDETDFLTLYPANEKHLLKILLLNPQKRLPVINGRKTLPNCQNNSLCSSGYEYVAGTGEDFVL